MMNRGDVTGSGRHSVDVWHVRLANGETRSLSLDELDAGFHDGWIDAKTPVLPAGAIRWAPLGEVAGLDDDAGYDAAPPSSRPDSIAPVALDAVAPSAADAAFDIDVAAESHPDVLAFRPRHGRTIFRVMTALVVVACLGFAGFKGKPAVQRALASRGAAAAAAAPVVAVAVATPTQAPPPVAPPPAAAPETTPVVPTMTLTSLPSAPQTAEEKKAAADAEKKAAAEAKKVKRAVSQKRGK